jgi:hypothetical protein
MGFLSSLLPMAAGAASTYFTGNPYLGMALAGGVTAKKTGSLQQGMLAGLSAYGGGQITGGLMGAGSAELGKTAVANAAEEATKQGLTGEAYNQAMQNSVADKMAGLSNWDKLSAGFANPSTAVTAMGGGLKAGMAGLAALAPAMAVTPQPQTQAGDSTMPQRLRYDQGTATPLPAPDVPGYDNLGQDFGRQQSYFPNAGYRQISPEEAKSIRGYAGGGPVEQMSNANAVGMNTGYPQADISGHAYATPWQTPVSQNVVAGTADTGVNRMSGQMLADGGMAYAAGGNVQLQGRVDFDGNPEGGQFGQLARQMNQGGGMMGQPGPFTGNNNATAASGLNEAQQAAAAGLGSLNFAFAGGGLSHLGDYSDGGRLLKGPGDGVSDSIPAVIGRKQPARLADGEFVVPARIVSELGNGSTEAGARKLYAMMDRVQAARGKTVGKGKVAKNSRADKYLPA